MCYELGKLKHIKTEYIEEVLVETVKLKILAEGTPQNGKGPLEGGGKKGISCSSCCSRSRQMCIECLFCVCLGWGLSARAEGRGETMDKQAGWEVPVLWRKLKLGEGITMKGPAV